MSETLIVGVVKPHFLFFAREAFVEPKFKILKGEEAKVHFHASIGAIIGLWLILSFLTLDFKWKATFMSIRREKYDVTKKGL